MNTSNNLDYYSLAVGFVAGIATTVMTILAYKYAVEMGIGSSERRTRSRFYNFMGEDNSKQLTARLVEKNSSLFDFVETCYEKNDCTETRLEKIQEGISNCNEWTARGLLQSYVTITGRQPR